jgi:hypothetical protein
MKEYRIYTGNNCKIIKENISECLDILSIVSNRINTTPNDPNLNNMRNVLIAHIKTLLNKINTCKNLSIPEINSLYQTPPFQVLCIDRGFKQHIGECWNDAIMMFFCYQDGIKETVQKKLYFLEPSEIIELAYSKRDINLPEMFKDNKYKKKFMTGITNYIGMMKTKFTSYYNNTKYPMSRDISIAAAMEGLEILRQCPSDIANHGAYPIEGALFIQILSYFLLDDELETKLILKSDIRDSFINGYLGFYVHWSSVLGGDGHVTMIYTCDRTIYHFDDNNFIRSNPSSYATPVRINNITEITNKNLYIGSSGEQTCYGILGIKIYDKITDKINRMNRFLEYEISKNVFDNIQYYLRNGADNTLFVSKLFNAILLNDINVVRGLLYSGIDPNLRDRYGYSVFYNPILISNVEIVRLLLSKGLNKNVTLLDTGGQTVLEYAIAVGNQEIINLLS